MSRYRGTLTYDGTAYQGFQRQIGDTPTIQLRVEAAIAAISGQAVTVNGAGRTDTGVHARGQVIAFDLDWAGDEAALLRAINANLPDDIALSDLCLAPGFHPRFDALARQYSYTVIQAAQRQPLLRHRTWRVYPTLNFEAMQTAAALCVGEHDFGTFGQPPSGEITLRTVYQSAWTQTPEPYGLALCYQVEANAFLKHMVRRMVGMMVDVGRGAMDIRQFEVNLHAADVLRAKTMAPPQGLILEFVRYKE